MLKIRMQRIGRRNDPSFRVVVIEHTESAKSGKFLEKLGSYYPKTKETILNVERIKYWLSVGAKTSDRMHNLLISEKIIKGEKINVLPQKSPVVKEKEEVEETTKDVSVKNYESGVNEEDESVEKETKIDVGSDDGGKGDVNEKNEKDDSEEKTEEKMKEEERTEDRVGDESKDDEKVDDSVNK